MTGKQRTNILQDTITFLRDQLLAAGRREEELLRQVESLTSRVSELQATLQSLTSSFQESKADANKLKNQKRALGKLLENKSEKINRKQEEKEEETEKPQYPFGNFEGKRILLVEDNSLNREIATVLLEETGAVVEEAENGLVAVNMVKNSSPGYYDLVFMDIQMPVMNGYDSTRHIRALERPDIKSMPIIAMSANAFAEDIKLCKESGMNEHIAKPIDFGKVLEILEKYL